MHLRPTSRYLVKKISHRLRNIDRQKKKERERIRDKDGDRERERERIRKVLYTVYREREND